MNSKYYNQRQLALAHNLRKKIAAKGNFSLFLKIQTFDEFNQIKKPPQILVMRQLLFFEYKSIKIAILLISHQEFLI